MKCDARKCQRSGEYSEDFCSYNILSVAPQGNKNDDSSVTDFMEYVNSIYPELKDIKTKIGYSIIQTFDTNNYIDTYVTDA